jgi:hypothetical protein
MDEELVGRWRLRACFVASRSFPRGLRLHFRPSASRPDKKGFWVKGWRPNYNQGVFLRFAFRGA